MFKFIAQLFVSAAVGAAVAAGANPEVRGHVVGALQESNTFIQQTVDANTAISADVNANVAAEDASVQSAAAVQVDNNVNLDQVLPEVLNAQADASADVQANASVESEDTDLTLLQQLGLSLGFDLDE